MRSESEVQSKLETITATLKEAETSLKNGAQDRDLEKVRQSMDTILACQTAAAVLKWVSKKGGLRLGDPMGRAIFQDDGGEDNAFININTADLEALCRLRSDPYTDELISMEAAKNIIKYRSVSGPFKRPEDILDVPGGFGLAFFEANRDIIVVK